MTIEVANNSDDAKHSVFTIVQVDTKAKNGKDLPKLIESLIKLRKSELLRICIIKETEEHMITRCDELYVVSCLKKLREEYLQCDINMRDLVVSYRETVAGSSSQTCLSKKLNREYLVVDLLLEAMSMEIVSEKCHCKVWNVSQKSSVQAALQGNPLEGTVTRRGGESGAGSGKTKT